MFFANHGNVCRDDVTESTSSSEWDSDWEERINGKNELLEVSKDLNRDSKSINGCSDSTCMEPHISICDVDMVEDAVSCIAPTPQSALASAKIHTKRLRIVKVSGCTFVNQYLIIQYLGRGASGRVFLAMDVHSRGLVAMKIVKKPSTSRFPPEKDPSVKVPVASVASFRSNSSETSDEKSDKHGTRTNSQLSSSHVRQASEDSTKKFRQKRPLRRQGQRHNHLSDILHEISVMREAGSHRNIVGLVEVVDDPKSHKMLIVMEYCDGGPVLTRSGMENGRKIPENLARLYFRDMVAGLQHLHRKKIIHGDLKPENALMSSTGRVMISDFGCSKTFGKLMNGMENLNVGFESHAQTHLREKKTSSKDPRESIRQCMGASDSQDPANILEVGTNAKDDLIARCNGTPAFLAPEMLRKNSVFSGRAADVYALGACLFCFIYGRIPFFAKTVSELFHIVRTEELAFPQQPEVSPALKDLLSAMLCKDPSKRIDLSSVAQHTWVTDTNRLPPPGQDIETVSDESLKLPPMIRSYACKERKEAFLKFLRTIEDCSKTKIYRKGQKLAKQGDIVSSLYYILDGRVGVTYSATFSRKSIESSKDREDALTTGHNTVCATDMNLGWHHHYNVPSPEPGDLCGQILAPKLKSDFDKLDETKRCSGVESNGGPNGESDHYSPYIQGYNFVASDYSFQSYGENTSLFLGGSRTCGHFMDSGNVRHSEYSCNGGVPLINSFDSTEQMLPKASKSGILPAYIHKSSSNDVFLVQTSGKDSCEDSSTGTESSLLSNGFALEKRSSSQNVQILENPTTSECNVKEYINEQEHDKNNIRWLHSAAQWGNVSDSKDSARNEEYVTTNSRQSRAQHDVQLQEEIMQNDISVADMISTPFCGHRNTTSMNKKNDQKSCYINDEKNDTVLEGSFSVFTAEDLVQASRKAIKTENKIQFRTGEYFVGIRGPGDLTGETILISRRAQHTCNVFSLSESLHLKKIDAESLRSTIKKNPVLKQVLAELAWARQGDAIVVEALLRLADCEAELENWEGTAETPVF